MNSLKTWNNNYHRRPTTKPVSGKIYFRGRRNIRLIGKKLSHYYIKIIWRNKVFGHKWTAMTVNQELVKMGGKKPNWNLKREK